MPRSRMADRSRFKMKHLLMQYSGTGQGSLLSGSPVVSPSPVTTSQRLAATANRQLCSADHANFLFCCALPCLRCWQVHQEQPCSFFVLVLAGT